MAKRGRPVTGQRHTKQATVRLDPPVMAQVDRYAEKENITRARAIEIIVRLGLAQINPSSRAGIDALSDPLRGERVRQLSDLDPKVAEEVARIEVDMLVQVIGGEIARAGREFQLRVEDKLGRKMSKFDDVAEAILALSYEDELTKQALMQDNIKVSKNITVLMPELELLQKEHEKQNTRKKTNAKSKTA